MNENRDTGDRPDGRPSVEERNIERLLAEAYQPEEPDADFAARLTDRMVDLAGNRARGGAVVRVLRGRVGVWALRVAAVAAAVVVGMQLGVWMLESPQPQAPAERPVAAVPAGLPRPTPMVVHAPASSAIPVENLLRPQPRRPAPAREPAAVGSVVRTSARQRRRLTLPDGSVVYLNGGTELAVTGPRSVLLRRGEIYVEVIPAVAADAAGATFRVQTPHSEIVAKGTRFGVRTADGRPGVMVTQGRVKVRGLAGVLEAGQQLYPDGRRAVAMPRATHLLDWTRDLMAAASTPLVPASDHAGGSLVAVDPDGQEARLSLRKYHVDVHVEDGFARTTIDQTYFNHLPSRLEGTFYFPLPADASLSRLAMYVNGKLMEGGMAERLHAASVYRSIVNSMKDPALLEWIDGTTFKMRVFPLEGRQEKRIVLSYTQRLESLYGRTTYRFPAGHTMQQVGRWSFRARLKSGAGAAWECDSHDLAARRDGGDLLLEAERTGARLDEDVVVRLRDTSAAAEAVGAETVAFSSAEHEGQTYLMLRMSPELPAQERRPRRHWVFLFESSADRDPLLARAQVEIVRGVLGRAERDDTFDVLTAGTRVRVFAPRSAGEQAGPPAATPANVEAAIEFLERTHLIGALDLEGALTFARELCAAGDSAHLVHLGSAIPVLGRRGEDRLLSLLPAAAKYVGVGVGKRWSRPFMKAAATRTGGYFTQINPDENVAWRAFELVATLNTPRLLAVGATALPEGRPMLCWTDSAAQGEQLCAMMRVGKGRRVPAAVRVAGKLDGRDWSADVPVRDVATKADYLPRIWARLEIDRLLATGRAKNRAQIVDLSKAMYVMSPFTSLLVLENEAMYRQYNVDRGRKDHWALYPCPETIPIVREPLGSPAAKPKPDRPDDADRKGNRKKEAAPKTRRWRSRLLETMIARVPAPFFQAHDRPQSTPQLARHRSLIMRGWGPDAERVDGRAEHSYTWAFGEADRFGSVGIPSRYLRRIEKYYEYGSVGIRGGVAAATQPGLLERYLWGSDRSGRDDFFTYAPTTYLWEDYDGDSRFGYDYYSINGVDGSIVVPYEGTMLLGGQVLTLTDGSLELGSYGTLGRIAADSGLTITSGDHSYIGGGTFTVNGTINSWHAAGPWNHSFVMPGSWNQGNLVLNGDFALTNGNGLSVWDTTHADSGIHTVSFSGNGLVHWGNSAGYVSGPPLLLVAPTVPGTGAGDVTAVTSEGERIPWYEHIRYPRDGKRSSRSAYALGDDADDADREVRQKLRHRIERLEFRGTDLADVVRFLSESAGVNTHVDWRELAIEGVNRNTKVTIAELRGITVERALKLALQDAKAGGGAQNDILAVVDSGLLNISTRYALAERPVRRVYDIRDLLDSAPGRSRRSGWREFADELRRTSDQRSTAGLFEDDSAISRRRDRDILRLAVLSPDFRGPGWDAGALSGSDRDEDVLDAGALFDEGGGRSTSRRMLERKKGRKDLAESIGELIQESVDWGSWQDHGLGFSTIDEPGRMQVYDGHLIVRQTLDNHRAIAELLSGLRRAKGIETQEEKLDFFPGEAEASDARSGRTVRELGVRFDAELDLPRIVSGASAKIDTTPYRRPSFSGYHEYFTNLLLYAPGLSNSPADVAAVLEAEAPPHERPARGRIERTARKLIDAARKGAWRTVTLPPGGEAGGLTVTFDGAGRYAFRRATDTGLIEKVICDGKTLLHVYPELGLAGRRQVSRFHRRQTAPFLPWVVPPADDLAVGADVLHGGERTVTVRPHLRAGDGGRSGRPTLQLTFAADGRLTERRLVSAAEGRTVVRQTLAADGAVRLMDASDRLVGELNCKLAAAAGPDLKPETAPLVVLSMPTRSPDHVLEGKRLNVNRPASWPAEAALEYAHAGIVTGGVHRWRAGSILWRRLVRHGDQRVGLYVLLRAAGWKVAPAPKVRPVSMATYLASLGQPAKWPDASQWHREPTGFIPRLAGFYGLWRQRHSTAAQDDTDHAIETWRGAVADYVQQTGPTAFSWALASEAVRLGTDKQRGEWAGLLVEMLERFRGSPTLGPSARYEIARLLLASGQGAKAAERFKQLYAEMARKGRPLWFDEAFRLATRSRGWPDVIVAEARRLTDSGARSAAVELAWQCRRAGDRELGAEIFATAAADCPPGERTALRVAAAKYHAHAGQWRRAEAALAEALEDAEAARVPALWNAAARVALHNGRLARAVRCADRAMEIRYRALDDRVNVRWVRSQVGNLLAGYQRLAGAIGSLPGGPPVTTTAGIVRWADRWRQLDTDAKWPCHAAADALRKLGADELAWEYLTTPLAAGPNESKGWLELAKKLVGDGEVDLADRAYAAASDVEAANAQILWDRASMLRRHGRRERAHTVLLRLANGAWEDRFDKLQRQARELLAR